MVLICVLLITAAIIIVVLLCHPRKGTFSNAWYVKYFNEYNAEKSAGLFTRSTFFIIR
jgi:preprotein translocase subunit SecG